MAETEEVVLTEEEQVEKKVREDLEEEYNSRLEVQLKEITQKLTENNQKVVTEAIEKFRKEMAPPSEEDVQKLLSQEYSEYKVEVRIRAGKGEAQTNQTRTFTIQELPQKVEKKIYRKIKEVLVPVAQDLAALSMDLLKGDAATKIVHLMNTFEPVLDVMVGIATICLNPYGEEEGVTEDWVATNLSATRIVKIVTAQVECNKMRDFFSLLFRGSKLMR
jgi:hypothetical protein